MFMAQPQPNDGFEWTQVPWGHVLRCRPLLELADHFFTAGDLRLRADDLEWTAVAQRIGLSLEHLLLIRQVHRADVAVVRLGRSGRWDRPDADVIVSNDPSSAVGVRVADCAPVLLADRKRGVVGAVHAGWRGTVQEAAPAGVEAMICEFGSEPQDLIAAIGPCLGPCCGEVGSEVVDAFREGGHGEGRITRWFTVGPSGRPHLDLWRANADQLEEAGLRAANIHIARLCTRTHAGHLHSYRAEGEKSGRMLGVIRPGNYQSLITTH
jgi:YfiH family protein